MHGYMDESGAPGVATNNNDYLVVSLVLFPDKASADKCSVAIDRLRTRLKLKDTYEFHRSHNHGKAQEGFMKLMSNLDFKFITIAIRKDGWREHGSYQRLAELLVREISERYTDLKIHMDSNPLFYSEIRKQLKAKKLRNVKIKEAKSHTDNLLQLADYVVNLSSKRIKNVPKASSWFKPIDKKQLVFLEITE